MKIHVDQIPEGGLTDTATVPAAPYDLDTEEVRVISPLGLSYRIFLEQDTLLVHLTIRCRMACVCSRCLGDYEAPFQKETDLAFPVEGAKVVDATDDVRQEILLDYPMKPLCAPGCKGICRTCKQNLNEGPCPCGN